MKTINIPLPNLIAGLVVAFTLGLLLMPTINHILGN